MGPCSVQRLEETDAESCTRSDLSWSDEDSSAGDGDVNIDLKNIKCIHSAENCGGPGPVRSNPDPGIQPEADVETLALKTEEREFWGETREPRSVFPPELQIRVKEEDPEPPRIKEEPEETEIPAFTFTSVPVKTEEDEEKPQSSDLHHSRTETGSQEPEPDKNGRTSDCSDPDTDDSDCWKQKRKPESGSNSEGKNRPSETLQPESGDSVDSDFWKDERKPQSSLNSSNYEVSEVEVDYETDLKPYSCIQCGKAFLHNTDLKIHMRQHTKKYFCSVCGHKSTSSSNLKVHMRIHTGEKPFSCQICGKKYTYKASLQSHMSVHSAETKSSCDLCNKSSASHKKLEGHSVFNFNSDAADEVIKKDLRNIKCMHSADCQSSQDDNNKPEKPPSSWDHKINRATDKSEDVSKTTDPLLSGINIPNKDSSAAGSGNLTDNKLLSCFFCETKFLTGGLLTAHTSVHIGETLLSCVVCKKAFGLESELKSHLCGVQTSRDPRGQAGDQVDPSQCGKAKSSQDGGPLRCQIRGDTFRCSVCSACCSDRDSLIQHMRIHTRQTQFNCSVCGKDFAWRRHLTKHMEVHRRKKRVFRCRICAAEFYTYYLLSKHKSIHQGPQCQENEQMETTTTAAAADGGDCGGPEPVISNPDPGSQPEADVETSALKAEEREFWEETKEPRSDLTSAGVGPERETKTTDAEDPSQHTVFPPELQTGVKEEDPEPPRIKEEPEETEIPAFTFTSVPVKTEEDEEKPQSSDLHHSRTETGSQEPEPDENGRTSDCSDPDTDDSDCWKQKRKPESGSNSEGENRPSETLQPESGDSVDSDFWKDERKPQSSLNSSKHEVSEVGAKYVTDLKPYSCIQCGKAFRYNSYLKIHMRQHTEKYFCSVCGHKSTSSSNLKVHMRTHTGEKPFSCQICGKKYTNKASLQSHMSVHSAERKYSCEACKKSFAWYTELKYHKCVDESSCEQTYEENAGINLKQHASYS